MDQIEQHAQEVLKFLAPASFEWQAKNNTTPPTASWALVSARSMLMVVGVYVAFVVLGTAVMKSRSRPIKSIMWLKYWYNPLQVVLCSWMCVEAARQALKLPGFVLVGNSYEHERTSMAEVVHIFYLSKVLDFMDTVFIIFGQKWEQLSFLHVYHHISIFIVYWSLINVGYDGDIYLTVVLNGFVHTVMYLYYMITSLQLYEPVASTKNVAKDAAVEALPYRPRWKWLVTYTQMVQFMLMNLQAAYLLYMGSAFPRRVIIFYLVYIQSLFWLFRAFAVKQYSSPGKKSKKQA